MVTRSPIVDSNFLVRDARFTGDKCKIDVHKVALSTLFLILNITNKNMEMLKR